MQISAINNCNKAINSSKNAANIQYSFKGNDKKSSNETVKTASLVALGVTAAVALVKNAAKLKETVVKVINKHKPSGRIPIPIKKTKLAVSSDALRKLPKEIKTKAIEALNNAKTDIERTEIIKKYGIGRFV